MVDSSPGNPQPNPNDPWLEGLTFDQIAQLINEVGPDVFYQRASAFDQAGARLQDVIDQIRHEMNLVRENWTGKASEDFDGVVRELTAKIGGILQFLQNPGYGATLRAAGDRLADHQQRLRDLQGQKTQQESQPPAPGAPSPEETAKVNNDSAKQILRDLRTAYWDVGNGLPLLPYKPPQVVAQDVGTDPPGPGAPNPGDDTFSDDSNTNVDPDTNNNQFFGPAFPPPSTKTVVNSESGPPGGGQQRFQFTGQGGGPDGQVLGRVDPGGQHFGGPGGQYFGGPGQGGQYFGGPGQGGQTFGGPVPGGPFMPGQPGSTFFAGGAPGNGPGVLGQKYSVTGKPEPLERVEGETTDVEPFDGVAPAVLGRPATCGPEGTTVSGRTGKDKDSRRKAVEEAVPPAEETLPETLSGEVDEQAEEKSRLIRTAVDAPAPEVTKKAHEIAGQAITASGQPIVATQGVAGTPALETLALPQGEQAAPAEVAKPEVAAALELGPDAKKALAFSAPSGGGGHVTHAIALDPESRGMFAPGSTTPDGLAVPVDPATSATAPAASGRAAADPYGSPHMGGMPMMGGMGGMGGMGQQNGSRMAAMPNEPRPEVWDPLTGAPVAVGRREKEKEKEKEERDEKISQEQVRAALAEKFAELDRLMERGK